MSMGIEQSTCESDNFVKISFPLLMKLFEWCQNDIQSCTAIHQMMEKMMAFNDHSTTLTMDVYNSLVDGVDCGVVSVGDCDNECDTANTQTDCCCGCDMQPFEPSAEFDIGSVIDSMKPNYSVEPQTVILDNPDRTPCEPCCHCEDEGLDEETLKQIQDIIAFSK